MMTNYQRRHKEAAELRRKEWAKKKAVVRQWLLDYEAPQDILDLLDEVATTPIYTWC